MLFPTFEFIFLFLPITLLAFLCQKKYSNRFTVQILLFSSVVFYLLPNWTDGYIIIGSIIVNFLLSKKIQSTEGNVSKAFLALGVCFNLCVISYFKYLFFFSEVLSGLIGYNSSIEKLILPVGISFYTFQQIAYLVDCYKYRDTQYNFQEYALFVTFFPQLIAGPIVHHKEIMPQISNLQATPFDLHKLQIGILIFIIGLSKKLVLADNLALLANPVFGLIDKSQSVDIVSAWVGSLAYTFQLYFDFSAYSDMAIGLGLMFGLNLPINFNSPYKSTSITEFWRRWHITLSTFLRDYLYIPLGGNRNGKYKRYQNLMLTMLLGGLWHGAGWNFIIWGGLHGLYLVINQVFSNFCRKVKIQLPNFIGVLLTMLAVIVAWVFFRAETTQGAFSLLGTMFGIADSDTTLDWVSVNYLLIGLAALIAFFAPNTAQLFSYQGCATKPTWSKQVCAQLGITRAKLFPIYIGLLLCLSLLFMPQPTVFLYFNF
jgi:D-alanyl-lipoteichoic acid acyltransferase DltB (MBOAT superfamily)